ncbi:MAG: polysaccharide biosynthesis protein, partial [Bacilli bacterium]|nr:polysaccharide biosynthesis protein [Bacilli bacterium]
MSKKTPAPRAGNHKHRALVWTIESLYDFFCTFGIYVFMMFATRKLAAFGSEFSLGCLLLGIITALTIVGVFAFAGIYRVVLSGYGLYDATKVTLLALAVLLTAFIVDLAVPSDIILNISLSAWILGIPTTLLALNAPRIAWRLLLYVRKETDHSIIKDKRTLLIGCGDAGKIVLEDSARNLKSRSNIVAIMDDDPKKIGRVFLGKPVYGPISNAPEIIKEHDIQEVIIAIASLSEERLKEIIKPLRNCPVEIRRFPLLSEMNTVDSKTILSVDINVILGREVVKLDNSEVMNMLHEQTVLITGAGGSIGSELVRQVYKTHPKTLILFDIYENGVYSIQQEIRREMARENCQDVNLVTLIGSTYNDVRLEQIFREYPIDYIYHAAAYKHVPLMEDSPMEAIRTNVIGTYNVARLADQYKVKKMLLVSTDKAVRPTNAMGATKRFAEMVIQSFAKKSQNTKYCAVRFGNVLGSNGSVIPLFRKQIDEGGPVTVTDPDIIRFFMTIPEAVSLVMLAGTYAHGGEIFVLDMGSPVKIA